jgi:DNA-3-methyladenine glycosylase II
MFAIFSLRRSDILPVGDLGVQRGLVRWFLSLHSSSHRYSISPDKLTGQPGSSSQAINTTTEKNQDVLPVLGKPKRRKSHNAETRDDELDELPVADVSSVLPAATPHRKGKSKGSQLPSMPTPFTPSINKILHTNANGNSSPPLPEGLSVEVLKSRLEGKKKIK